jgi:hypothetical protein
MIILILKVERKKISCKDTEVIKKYPACLKDEIKISSSVENAQPPHQKSNGPALSTQHIALDISVMLMLLYFLITKLYCALLALWKSRRISSQMKQCTDMSHCHYMFSKGKQLNGAI